MCKSEENDLKILIRSVNKTDLQQFAKQLILADDASKLCLLNSMQKKIFDKKKFIRKHQLNAKQYNSLKFKLFKDVINHLKINYNGYTDIAFQNEVIEYELLLKNGLYVKAYRKLKMIKKINKCNNFETALNELNEYYSLAKNLSEYKLMNLEALNLHYKFLDCRAKDGDIMLKYLDHDLLQNESKATSKFAKYYFYITKSLIYLGINDYTKSKKNALLAYECISSNTAKSIDSYKLSLIALNNYLDASLNLSETAPFETIYPKMLEMRDYTDTKDFFLKAKEFQQLCSLHLNYLWIKKDYKTFLKCCKAYEKDYQKYEANLSPNFKLEILLGLARMYFESGNPTKADQFCNQIVNQKSNPTSMYLACGNLLRIMINVDVGNYKFIPNLVNASRYFLKNRNRLFDVERLFFNNIKKLQPYFTARQKKVVYKKLYEELSSEIIQMQEVVINTKIRLLPWLKFKISL